MLVKLSLAALVSVALSSPVLSREVVAFNESLPAGVIVVKTGERKLYLTLPGGRALRYPVAVGKRGKLWFGQAYIQGKYVRPAWSPPAEIRRDKPYLPRVIPGGAPNNPMGERALLLRDEYAIHGTNRPGSIGRYASYGCIRMFNRDIVDLYERVSVGTLVVVTR